MTSPPIRLSVIVPTLNASTTLEATLSALRLGDRRPHSKLETERGSDFSRSASLQSTNGTPASPRFVLAEILISDGGSSDATVATAVELGARIVEGPAGRGGQLRRGAAAASGDWFLFLHADTRLGPQWPDVAGAHVAGPDNLAGFFQFALDDPSAPARRLERMAGWRARALRLPYGDQGLLISRRHYEALGGYRDIPLMEDVDLVRRIGAKGLCELGCPAVTSAAKFRRSGYWLRSARNLLCLGLYYGGVDPRLIKKVYG